VKGRGQNGIFFSKEGLPRKGDMGKRDVFSGIFRKIKGEREVFQVKGFPVKGRGEDGIFFREIERD
jgi:hypothetical protein